MKKSASPEQNRVRQPRAGSISKASPTTVATAKGMKLSPARKQEPVRLLEEHFPNSEAHAVSFEYFNPAAREVLVAGSFNDWQPRVTPMTKQRGGKWSAELLLKPGHYEYRFVVDGQWQDDPMAARFVANSFGGLNCVVEVKGSEPELTARLGLKGSVSKGMDRMNSNWIRSILIASMVISATGCSSLLPRSEAITRSKWKSFEEASASFDRILPGATRTNQLAELGFDPSVNPNVRILTYLDIIQRFMPNQSITKEELDKSVRECIEAREQSQAWEIELTDAKSRRYGNALLDLTGFVKKTHETGWQFKGLLLIRDGQVVYKLASGQPKVDRYEKKLRPLGPLQEIDSLLFRTVQSAW